jgi:hypothetical protein
MRNLRSELLELDLDLEPATTASVPIGARAAEAFLLGAFVVRLARTSEALSSLVRAVRACLGDHRERRIRIELDGDILELSGASDVERERLVNAWIERHGTA